MAAPLVVCGSGKRPGSASANLRPNSQWLLTAPGRRSRPAARPLLVQESPSVRTRHVRDQLRLKTCLVGLGIRKAPRQCLRKSAAQQSIVDFVDFNLIDRMVGVSPYRPQARNGVFILIRTYE